jgi:hypothetical protein
MTKSVAAGGDSQNSTITFLVSGNADWPPLRSAWLWVRELVEKHRPGAEVHAVTSVHALWHALMMRNRAIATAKLESDVLESTFGGLRGHSLIWLFPGNFLAPETVIPFVGQGRLGLTDEQALSVGVLDKLSAKDGRVIGSGGPIYDAWGRAFTPLFAGFFHQLVLVPVGSDLDIDAIANKIHGKLGINVYWNTRGLVFPDDPAPEVGSEAVEWQEFVGAVRTNTKLAAKADAFLPGTMRRAVGKAAKQ